MIRVTDQYFWNFVFSFFFLVLVFLGVVILETEAYRQLNELTVLDLVLMALATQRLIRLFVYDTVTKFFREQFWDVQKTKAGYILEKPKSGPRRTLADLLSCPWCFGVWAGATVVFFYLWSPAAYYIVLILAISGMASQLQLLANLIGWQAEKAKQFVE